MLKSTLIVALLRSVLAFQTIQNGKDRPVSFVRLHAESRRNFLQNAALAAPALVLGPKSALSDDEDLTSKLYNPDGSVKDDVEKEAKFRDVQFLWDQSENLLINVDGVNKPGTSGGKMVEASYRLPLKWADGKGGDQLYYDRSEGVNAVACDRITVYQAPGNVGIDQLQKATTIGVGKALRVTDELSEISEADIIGGRTRVVDGQKYYDFDMAVAPKTCGSSTENLGLGFCPFDSIYLISSTILNDKLYVFVIQSNKDEWKRANSDIKVVRTSFKVSST